jgi:hypothetical protein
MLPPFFSFNLSFFSQNLFPQAPENNIGVISIFFKFLEIFATKVAQPVSVTMAVNRIEKNRIEIKNTGEKFATGANKTVNK